MDVRRVFVVWRHPLFYGAVRLLLNHPKIALVGATSDCSSGKEQISVLEPDVVIVEKVAQGDQCVLDPAALMHGNSKVIYVGMSSNELTVLRRQMHVVGTAEDLLGVVLANNDEEHS